VTAVQDSSVAQSSGILMSSASCRFVERRRLTFFIYIYFKPYFFFQTYTPLIINHLKPILRKPKPIETKTNETKNHLKPKRTETKPTETKNQTY
jgi:hypothetical protein